MVINFDIISARLGVSSGSVVSVSPGSNHNDCSITCTWFVPVAVPGEGQQASGRIVSITSQVGQM